MCGQSTITEMSCRSTFIRRRWTVRASLPSQARVLRASLPSEARVLRASLPSQTRVLRASLPSQARVLRVSLPSQTRVLRTNLPSEALVLRISWPIQFRDDSSPSEEEAIAARRQTEPGRNCCYNSKLLDSSEVAQFDDNENCDLWSSTTHEFDRLSFMQCMSLQRALKYWNVLNQESLWQSDEKLNISWTQCPRGKLASSKNVNWIWIKFQHFNRKAMSKFSNNK